MFSTVGSRLSWWFVRGHIALSLAAALLVTACPEQTETPDKPAVEAPAVAPSPLRRLTQAELNRTLGDLFPGVTLPVVTMSDGAAPPGGGAQFEGDVSRQTPSDLVIEQLRAGVIAVTAQVMTRPDLLYPRQPSADLEDQRAVGHELIAAFGPRALRRPYEDGEQARYSALFDGLLDAEGLEVATQAVLQAFLQAPAFLYRIEFGTAETDPSGRVPVTAYEMASRLSYFLWGSMPDAALFERADDGSLLDDAGVIDEARRMLTDQRAHAGVLSFHRQWLDLDKILSSNKDPATHPAYNEALRQAMRTEADLFIESVVFGGDARLQTLLTSNVAPVNAALADVYGVPAPAQEWTFVPLPEGERAGLLTQAQFLGARAHAIEPSPVLRGVFVLERLLCEQPPAPDGNIDTTPPERDPNAQTTNRERFSQHTFDPVCQGCHVAIDGIGFGLESYDAIGRYRTTDNGLPVDDTGTLQATAVGGTFEGGVELSQLLAGSPSVQRCVARHWFRNSLGRKEGQLDQAALSGVAETFVDSGGDIHELLIAIVGSDAFRFRPAIGGAG